MRSLQSMFIIASTQGFTFEVSSEGEVDYTGKNPRDAFQAARELDEVTVNLRNDEGEQVDWAFIIPGQDDYMVDCNCNGFFDKWSN
jgi:hypothetical protein